MSTAKDIVDGALRELGVLAAGEDSSAEDSSHGFSRLNRFLDRLTLDGLSAYVIARNTWTLVSGTGTYNVGTGQDVAIAIPVWVERIGFIDTSTSPVTEYGLHRLTEDEWASIPLKTQEATFPSDYRYSRQDLSTSQIDFFPVPTSSTLQGVIYHRARLNQLTALSTTVTLPAGYEEMLITNLAVLLAPSFNTQASQDLREAARMSLAAVKIANVMPTELTPETTAVFGGRGAYDINLS